MEYRTFIIGGLIAFSAQAVSSCTGNEDDVTNPKKSGAFVSMPQMLYEDDISSRTSVTDAGTSITYQWADGDALGIFPEDGSQISFSLTPSTLTDEGRTAEFDGGSWALKDNNTYYAYYPYSANNTTNGATKSSIPYTYDNQVIQSFGSTSHIGSYDYQAASGLVPTDGALAFTMVRLGALLRISVSLPATTTYHSMMLSATTQSIPVSGTIDLTSGPSMVSSTYAKDLTVSLNETEGTAGQNVLLYVMLPPMNLHDNNEMLTMTLNYGSGQEKLYELRRGEKISTPNFKANYIYLRDAYESTEPTTGEVSLPGYNNIEI